MKASAPSPASRPSTHRAGTESIPLSARTSVNQLVADDNRDRSALYREIAAANGHPEWQAQIQATFARRWIDLAQSGWYYQSGGQTGSGWKAK